MSVWVTPGILAGPEDCRTNVVTVRCETAEEIVRAVQGGTAAWVPVDPWDEIVFDAMTQLGVGPVWARRDIHYARTGVLLPAEDFE